MARLATCTFYNHMVPLHSLREHIVSLATSSPKKTILFVCNREGTLPKEITREESSRGVEVSARQSVEQVED